MGTGLTSKGYWALLRGAGIAPFKQVSDHWMANNRLNETFSVPDPTDLTPAERQDAADYFIEIYGG